MSRRTIGILGVLALVLGVSLLVVPAALADRPQEYPSVTQSESATPAEEVAVRPDDLPGLRGPGAVATEPVVIASDGGAFDWTEAAVGATLVIGVVLLTGLAVWTATRHGPGTGRHAHT
jgi:small neutral amino acid transporter SnatA (MarC family)